MGQAFGCFCFMSDCLRLIRSQASYPAASLTMEQGYPMAHQAFKLTLKLPLAVPHTLS